MYSHYHERLYGIGAENIPAWKSPDAPWLPSSRKKLLLCACVLLVGLLWSMGSPPWLTSLVNSEKILPWCAMKSPWLLLIEKKAVLGTFSAMRGRRESGCSGPHNGRPVFLASFFLNPAPSIVSTVTRAPMFPPLTNMSRST